ncbi:MAG: trehalose utilization [Cytophagaceae bacterium SCN 52-12]|nr:MAG: trehalose utilization [Cytophagaceae bacterium SCN 52-12]
MKYFTQKNIWFLVFLICSRVDAAYGQGSIQVMLIDGQNNHSNMFDGSRFMKQVLEETGLFKVDIVTTPPAGGDMAAFRPDFSRYDVVLSNYNGDPWTEQTKLAFEQFVAGGGGLVVVHAADNAFPAWEAYNLMIGIGGWEGRDERSGPYLYFDEHKNEFVQDITSGKGGSHGVQHEFLVTTRDPQHPIMKGLPKEWLHQKDELYDRLRGPAKNVTVLATAHSTPETKGSGRHEPVLMTIRYGKGRVFHTTLGHENYSQKCVGFIATLQRGAEWAAKGKVTQPVPKDFPSKDRGAVR